MSEDHRGACRRDDVRAHHRLKGVSARNEDEPRGRANADMQGATVAPVPSRRHGCPAHVSITFVAGSPDNPRGRVHPPRDPPPAAGGNDPTTIVERNRSPRIIADPLSTGCLT